MYRPITQTTNTPQRISYARNPSHATLARQDPEASREAAVIRAAKMTVSNAQGEYEQLEREKIEEDLRLAGNAMGKRELDEPEDGPAGKRVKQEGQGAGAGGDDEEMEIEMEMDDDEGESIVAMMLELWSAVCFRRLRRHVVEYGATDKNEPRVRVFSGCIRVHSTRRPRSMEYQSWRSLLGTGVHGE